MKTFFSKKTDSRFQAPTGGAGSEPHGRHWVIFFTVIVSLKFLIYLVDPFPMLLMGDSASYLHTALTGWIPPDRSFVYGFLLKWLCVSTGSLDVLVVFQTFLGVFVAIMVSYCLITFMNTPIRTAHLMGTLCAIDPLQLMYERFVMTETVALFLLSLYIFLSFKYIKSRQLMYLVFVQILGVLIVSVRLSFLPLILVNTIVLPALLSSWFSMKPAPDSTTRSGWWGNRPILHLFSQGMIVHLLLSVAITFVLHHEYKKLNGSLTGNPPAYQYSSGFFLLGDWCPVVKPVDFPDPDVADKIFESLKYELTNPWKRPHQRWLPGGLISLIIKEYPDLREAERLCKQTAMNCLKRDPFGIARLAWKSFCHYWVPEYLQVCLLLDSGSHNPPKERTLKKYKEKFGLSRENVDTRSTVTKRYFYFAWPYYLFLLCSPVLAFLLLLLLSRESVKLAIILFLTSSEIIIVSCFLIERPTPRYLHAAGFVNYIVLGIIMNIVLETWGRIKRDRDHAKPPHQIDRTDRRTAEMLLVEKDGTSESADDSR